QLTKKEWADMVGAPLPDFSNIPKDDIQKLEEALGVYGKPIELIRKSVEFSSADAEDLGLTDEEVKWLYFAGLLNAASFTRAVPSDFRYAVERQASRIKRRARNKDFPQYIIDEYERRQREEQEY